VIRRTRALADTLLLLLHPLVRVGHGALGADTPWVHALGLYALAGEGLHAGGLHKAL